MYFDHAADGGLDDSVNVDAITEEGDDLLLSFETTTVLTLSPLAVAADEDLVLFDRGQQNPPAIFFDGSLQGVPEALDLDGADLRPDGRLVLSFDVAGTVPGIDGPIAFEDEDLLVFDLNDHTWSLLFDASAFFSSLVPNDVDAIAASVLLDPTATPTDTASPTPTSTDGPPPATNTPTSTPTRTPGGPTDTPTATATATATGSPVVIGCPGDCNGNRVVDVSELIRGVNLALGGTAGGECTQFDTNSSGTIEIDELVAAVARSVMGCV
jgi:hypothetical protein